MDEARFARATAEFDRRNAEDPVTELVSGTPRPRLLLQAERLGAWVERLEPNPSEALRLAARCQHLERWKIPRSDYPDGRVGYLTWRTRLGRFHAEQAARVLRDAGYDDVTVKAVEHILTKQNLRSNHDSQTMEDALCLVFLEYELEAFLDKYPDEAKAVDILQKTWRKMSARGHEAALRLTLSERGKALVARALSPA
ncbi:MAG TPA: DUF4202 domain-containing protein [Polyangiaceae bacterium]